MVKILAALSILNSSCASPGATKKVARATCSGASHSSAHPLKNLREYDISWSTVAFLPRQGGYFFIPSNVQFLELYCCCLLLNNARVITKYSIVDRRSGCSNCCALCTGLCHGGKLVVVLARAVFCVGWPFYWCLGYFEGFGRHVYVAQEGPSFIRPN